MKTFADFARIKIHEHNGIPIEEVIRVYDDYQEYAKLYNESELYKKQLLDLLNNPKTLVINLNSDETKIMFEAKYDN